LVIRPPDVHGMPTLTLVEVEDGKATVGAASVFTNA